MNRIGILAGLAAGFLSVPAMGQLPALMYHAHENLGYERDEFIAHMDALVANGYSGITIEQFRAWYYDAEPIPYRSVLITVDDNYILTYTDMFPILKERGLVGINYTHTWGIGIGAPKASWDNIREMEADGTFITESHSRTHPQLTTLSAEQLQSELVGSKQDIEDQIPGKTVISIAYPYGDYNQTVLDATGDAGYLLAFTTVEGLARRSDPPLELPRVASDNLTAAELEDRLGLNNLPPAPPGEGWILDNSGKHFFNNSTSWFPSTSEPGYYAANYHARFSDAGQTAVVRWASYLPAGGEMRVYARWTSHANRASDATYTIVHAGGETSVAVDQRERGGQWVELAVVTMPESGLVDVSLGGEADGVLIADALWFEPVSERGDVWVIH